MNRTIITLECKTCKERNYTTTKNKKKTQDKLALSKYCPRCRKHVEHKETKSEAYGEPHHHHARMPGVQRAELHDHEEQADHDRQAGPAEILPTLPQAHGAQGDEVGDGVRPVAPMVERRSPKPHVPGSSPGWPANRFRVHP